MKGNSQIIDGNFVQCYLHLNNTHVTNYLTENETGGECKQHAGK